MARCLLLVLLTCVLLAQGAQVPAPKPVPITKEALKERIAALEQAREQAIANVNALGGAIQECNFWLSQLEAAEKEVEKKQEQPKPPPKKE